MSFIYEAGKREDGKRRGGKRGLEERRDGKRRIIALTRRRCEPCG